MKNLARLLAAVALLGACKDPGGENVILAPNRPLAYTRFVNAVNDTGPTDWRFIDQIDESPYEFGLEFRGFSPYQGTAPGVRHLRIFPTSTDILVTQRHFIDTLITLDPDTYYTIIHMGASRAAPGSPTADRVRVIEEQRPSLAANNVGIRFIHAAVGIGGQDAFAVDTTVSPILGATPTFLNVTFGSASNYTNRAVGRLAFRSTNTGTFNVTAQTFGPPGRAADLDANLSAVGGWSIDQSLLTGIFFPAAVPGSQATPAFIFPGIVFLVDRHPN